MSAPRPAPPARVIVVDDDVRYGEWLRHHLDVLCPQASVSLLNLSEFERWCTNFSGRDCDLLLLGAAFGSSPEDPDAHGLKMLRGLREQPAAPAVIALASDGNELTAVRALQLGAVDYLPKRLLTPERLSTAVRVARRIAARALPVTASDSHADGGADWASEVRTSTSSPFRSSEDSGANLPLILHPTALLPTSVCTA